MSENWILTAAHCTYGVYYVRVGVGSNNIKGLTYHNSSYIITHPSYNQTTIQNDIALIKICKGLIFNEYVKAIRLPDLGYKCLDFINRPCTVSGFGLTNPSKFI